MAMMVSQMHEQFVEAIQLILQEGVSERTVEKIVDAPVPQVAEQIVHVANSVPQECMKQHASMVDVPVPVIMQVQALAVQVARKSQTAQKMQKTIQGPQAHLSDTAMDIPVAHQRQVPTIQRVQRTVAAPKVQFVDKVVDIPVDLQRNIATIRSTQKTVEVPRVQCMDGLAKEGFNHPGPVSRWYWSMKIQSN